MRAAAFVMTDFPSLFQPLRIGPLTVRNRILQPAHAKLFSQHSSDTERDLEHHDARARGGCGLLITGERLVHPTLSTGRARFTYAHLQLKAADVEARRIGDCLAPRTIDHAIYEGYVAGRELFGDDQYIAEGRLDAVLSGT
jgi:hypothetical protein